MTKEEYLMKMDKEFREHKRRLITIQQEYAESNNPIKVGDVITDHYHTIKVEGWDMYVSAFESNSPSLKYYGVRYTKQGVKSKKQNDTEIYQGNIRYINGKAV